MSIRFEIQGQTSGAWTLSMACAEQISSLIGTPEGRIAEAIFDDKTSKAGVPRSMARRDVLKAVEALIPLAENLPGGFDLTIPPIAGAKFSTTGGGGMGGLLINGKYHIIFCRVGYWTLQPIEDMSQGLSPARRTDDADIQTENLGVMEIRRKKSRRNDLVKLLTSMAGFLKNDHSEEVRIVWG